VGGATDPPADTAIPTSGANAGEIPTAAVLTGGAPGKLLKPSEAAFETALKPASGSGGIYYLDRIDLFNLLCVPGETTPATLGDLETFCRDRRAFLIADCAQTATFDSLVGGPATTMTGDSAINAAFYFPWIVAQDPLQENRPAEFPPCGYVAGIYARTD